MIEETPAVKGGKVSIVDSSQTECSRGAQRPVSIRNTVMATCSLFPYAASESSRTCQNFLPEQIFMGYFEKVFSLVFIFSLTSNDSLQRFPKLAPWITVLGLLKAPNLLAHLIMLLIVFFFLLDTIQKHSYAVNLKPQVKKQKR